MESPYNAIFEKARIGHFSSRGIHPPLGIEVPNREGGWRNEGRPEDHQIMMLEELEKEHKYEETNNEKRKRVNLEPSENGQTLNIELENFGTCLSRPIAKPTIKVEEVKLYVGCSGKMFCIGKNMNIGLKENVIAIARQYHDVFSWGPVDMPGLDLKTSKHCLTMKPEAKPVKQKKRTFAIKRQKVIEAEV